MKDLYKNKKFGILGLGISGVACYKKLLGKVSKILFFDDNCDSLKKFKEIHSDEDIKSIHDPSWTDLDLILISPGIPIKYPYPHTIIEIAKKNNIEIIGDIDLLYLENPKKKFIAVTGTNGKSTIASFIYHIAKQAGLNYALCGNIGIPALSLEGNYDGYIIELSSFQLELIKYLKLDIAIISNITEDHLDRYKNLDSYVAAKMKIFDICNGDKIIGMDSEIVERIDFSKIKNLYKIFKKNDRFIIEYDSKPIIEFRDSLLANKILTQNYIYSYIAMKCIGLNEKEIFQNATSFKALKHRMEFIGDYRGINFYNDSKATNVSSAIAAISSLDNIYLLAGGISKGVSYKELEKYLANIKKLYLFGQSKYEIASFFQSKIEISICENMRSACQMALNDAMANDSTSKNILLAPMCSSFDQFKNFEDRGDKFIELFNEIRVL